jgi:hypothetical protein
MFFDDVDVAIFGSLFFSSSSSSWKMRGLPLKRNATNGTETAETVSDDKRTRSSLHRCSRDEWSSAVLFSKIVLFRTDSRLHLRRTFKWIVQLSQWRPYVKNNEPQRCGRVGPIFARKISLHYCTWVGVYHVRNERSAHRLQMQLCVEKCRSLDGAMLELGIKSS